MADTVFQDNVASAANLVYAAWLNDQNNLTYRGIDPKYATTAGTANAQTLTISAMSSSATLTNGMCFTMKVGAALTNTAALTLAVNGFAAKSVTNADGSALAAGQWLAGQIVTVVYDGTQYQFLNARNTGVFGALSATTLSLSGALTYGGVTLTAAVTGTGKMVLDTSPTFVTPALGTPSSGVVTNLTGTASININGTVGATTPTTGAFTTLSASGHVTFEGVTSTGATGTGNLVFSASPTFTGTLNAAAITATGTITPSQTNGIVGTTTNNDANAGSVGEYIESSTDGGTTGYTAGTQVNGASITLTAGDWDVEGMVVLKNSAVMTWQYLKCGLSTTSATLGTGIGDFSHATANTTYAGDTYIYPTVIAMSKRVKVASGTQVVYVVGQGGFTTGGTCGMSGFIRARRRR